MIANAYSIQKRGNAPHEYEDAYSIDVANAQFALADGATESCFSKQWASLLVNGNLNSSVRWQREWKEWLPELQQQWWQLANEGELPWYLERKVQEGASATFINLSLQTDNWQSSAVGDCCLFHIRSDKLLKSFPVENSECFNVNPPAVCSRFNCANWREDIDCFHVGKFQEGDCFILASDALAEWALKQFESKSGPWQRLLDLPKLPSGSFESMIEEIRTGNQIRNDDVTLLCIQT